MNQKATHKILAMVDEGTLDALDVLIAALKYMGEDEVRKMCAMQGIEWDDEGEDEEGEQ